MLCAETEPNAPVKLPDGSTVIGAEASLKPSIRQERVSVVEAAEIDWKADSTRKTADDIHRHRPSYVLCWQGLIQPPGMTRLRLAHNSELKAVTLHEVLETTGTTRQNMEDLVFGIGVLLGKAALDPSLGSMQRPYCVAHAVSCNSRLSQLRRPSPSGLRRHHFALRTCFGTFSETMLSGQGLPCSSDHAPGDRVRSQSRSTSRSIGFTKNSSKPAFRPSCRSLALP